MEMRILKCPEDNEIIRDIVSRMEYSQPLGSRASEKVLKIDCDDVKKYKFGYIVAPLYNIEFVAGQIAGSGVKLVYGGPAQSGNIEAAVASVNIALDAGCDEIDMAISHSDVFAGKYDLVQSRIATIAEITHKRGKLLKIIIGLAFLRSSAEKVLAARLALEAGADIIKFDTGFYDGRANLHDILLLKETFGDNIRLKASGRIPSLEDAWAFVQAGVERVAFRHLVIDQLEAKGYTVD